MDHVQLLLDWYMSGRKARLYRSFNSGGAPGFRLNATAVRSGHHTTAIEVPVSWATNTTSLIEAFEEMRRVS
jgi:hypothetical protein